MAPSYSSMGTFPDLEISILSRLALVIAQVSLWHSDYLIVYPYNSPCIARITVKDSRRYYANNSIYSSITGLGWAVLVFGLNSKLVCVLARGRFVFSNSKFLRHELHERCIPLGTLPELNICQLRKRVLSSTLRSEEGDITSTTSSNPARQLRDQFHRLATSQCCD